MSSSFSIALTGLESESQAIDITGNNLANMNTNGFKESEADFKDLFSESYGISSGLETGLGVSIPNSNQVFTQGSIESAPSPLAAAIQGNGFFVVQAPDGQNLYTRDGNFTTNQDGVLQTETGENVQGWTAGADGVVNTNDPTSSIVLPAGQVLSPNATTTFSLVANLNAQAVAGTSTGTFTAPMQVVDSLGNTHNLTVTFTQSTTDASTWNFAVSVPSADLSSTGALTGGTGSITFNSNGTMSVANTTGTDSNGNVPITISGLADGAADLNMTWDLFDPTSGAGNITGYAETSALASSTQDGNQAAQLTSVAIQSGGQVVATYSNGQTQVEAQLAMAAIENPQSLSNVGDNNFAVTGNTAIPAVGVPQSGGRGQILGNSLETSNVDMATQFTDLIVYQSAYQASSRVISTVNNMNQDLFSLIH
jgi:flagellar hook protein FlgE